MANFLFVNGQIRALESKLLTTQRLDRMVGAATPQDAFRILVELQYAEYVDDTVTAQDFTKIIERGLLETKELIIKGTNNNQGLQFLWARFDLNNLKRAYKLKLLQEKTELGEFTEENGFSLLGNLSPEEITSLVFNQSIPENLPEEYLEVIKSIEESEGNKEFRLIEFALDKAYFAYLNKAARKSGSVFLKKLWKMLVDTTNLRSLARSILVLEEALPKEAFIEGGEVRWLDTENIKNLDFISSTPFAEILEGINDNDASEEKLMKVEKALDLAYKRFLGDASQGEISSIQVPLAYFERRLQNSRMIKLIMFAKFHGLKPEQIYQILKQF
ncbi:V-type ATPase subunit [Candidatus Gracilibacteria bacterium]|nr:V-type ATPase subunit [Candidatus Gracilibacteria bacterium]